MSAPQAPGTRQPMGMLMLGAVGVVFGDVGTSVEVLHLGGDAHVVRARIEVRDRSTAIDAGHQVPPERGVVVADGGDGTEAGHDGSAGKVWLGHGRAIS